MQDIQMKALTLGTIICRFTVPQTIIDEINDVHEKNPSPAPNDKELILEKKKK